MKVRTYGFNFDKSQVCEAMPPQAVFELMAANPGTRLGTTYQFGATKVVLPCGKKEQEWWGGMMVRIRDSHGYLKLTEKPGMAVLSEETLGEGEKLAEISFFIAHPKTGNGLLTHHYHATSLHSFGRVCNRVYAKEQKLRRDVELSSPDLTGKAKKEISRRYRGKLEIGQLCVKANLKTLVKSLKSVSFVDFALTTIVTKHTMFQGVASHAQSERVRFFFPKEADVDGIADSLDEPEGSDNVESVEVHGRDPEGVQRKYSDFKNPAVFDERDYDTMMKGLKLDLTDWKASIQKSGAIKRLGAVASADSVMQLLEKA